jgi:hypothetical protein
MPTLQDVLDELLGAGETALTLGTGAASGVAGMPYGLYKGLTSGKYLEGKAADIASKEAARFMDRNTYLPRTRTGQENLSAIAKIMEASKLPPVIPEAVMLSSIPRAAAAAQAERLGMAAEKALEAPVARTMAQGGRPAQLLSDLARGSQSKIFIGPEAKTWDQKAAIKAANMERKGATAAEIWAETGTARGPDKMWRQEISDKDAQISQAKLPSIYIEGAGDVPSWKVGQVLNHPELMSAYPDIAKIESSFTTGNPEARAMLRPGKDIADSWISYSQSAYRRPFVTKRDADALAKAKSDFDSFMADPKVKAYDEKVQKAFDEGTFDESILDLALEKKRNELSDKYFPKLNQLRSDVDYPAGYTLGSGQGAKSSTLHEIQHAIQERERFGVGGNARDFARMKGEAETKISDLNQQMIAVVRQMDNPATSAAQKAELKSQYDALMSQRDALVPTAQIDPMEAYGHLMGEAEARLTQRRLDLTPEQRRKNFTFQYTGDTGFGFDVEPSKMIRMTPEGNILDRGLLGKDPMEILLQSRQK